MVNLTLRSSPMARASHSRAGEAAVTDAAGEEGAGLQFGIREHCEDALARAELGSEQEL